MGTRRKTIADCIAAIIMAIVIALALPSNAHASTDIDTVEWQVLYILNAKRMEEGLEAVSTFDDIQDAADERGDELEELFSHTRPDGGSCFDTLDEYGIRWDTAGENIAAGYSGPEQVMAGWMQSQPHRENMLTQSFSHVGIAHNSPDDADYDDYWLQLFIGSCLPKTLAVEQIAPAPAFSVGTTMREIADTMCFAITGTCEHGEFRMPLDAEMCSGFDPSHVGTQTLTVHHNGISCNFELTLNEGKPFMPGDANEDGVVNTADAALVLRYTVGLAVVINLDAADYNMDGTISTGDAGKILRTVVGFGAV